MTDKELIELLRDKPLQELSADEIGLLRSRMQESASLRAQISKSLSIEQALATALGSPSIDTDEIFARLHSRDQRAVRPRHWTLSAAILAVLLATCLGLLLRIRNANVDSPVAVTSDSGETPDKNEGLAAEKPASASTPDERENTQSSKPDAPASKPDAAPRANTSEPEPDESIAGKSEKKPSPQPAGNNPLNLPQGPWLAEEGLLEKPLSYRQFIATPVSLLSSSLDAKTFRMWFNHQSGHASKLRDRQVSKDQQATEFDGVFLMQAPWIEDAVLRLLLHDSDSLKIHFFAGQQGATLILHQSRPETAGWSGYITQRKADSKLPHHYLLHCNDNNIPTRLKAINPARIDVRFQDGFLLAISNGIPLLQIPLKSPPEEIVFEGKGRLAHISMRRCEKWTIPSRSPLGERIAATRLSKQENWQTDLPAGCSWKFAKDQSATLHKPARTNPATVRIPWHTEGILFHEMEISDPATGTGFFIGDENGKPYVTYQFLQERIFRQQIISRTHDPRETVTKALSLELSSYPFVSHRFWIRIGCFDGVVQTWLSEDANHWVRMDAPFYLPPQRMVGYLGLTSGESNEERSITLRQLRVQPLTRLNAMLNSELLKQAPLVPTADLEKWSAEVEARKPPEVDSRLWRTACAARLAASGTDAPAAEEFVQAMFEQIGNARHSLADRMQLLNELLTLGSSRQPQYRGHAFYQRYYTQLGEEMLLTGQHDFFSELGIRAFTAPAQTQQGEQYFNRDLIRMQLADDYVRADWNAIFHLCHWLRTFRNNPLEGELTAYARTALEHLPRNKSQQQSALTFIERHPLIIQFNKEAFNVLGELQVAVKQQDYENACEIIANAAEVGVDGLLPDSVDPNLAIAVPEAIDLAMQRHPELRSTMRTLYGPRSKLELFHAIDTNDRDTILRSTIQYYGTEAAAEAHFWLGNQALSIGEPELAISYYDKARKSAAPSLEKLIHSHKRLAAAMLGIDWGTKISTDVTIGEANLSAREFEEMIAELLRQSPAGKTRLSGDVAARASVSELAAEPLQSQPRMRMDGNLGRNTNRLPASLSEFQVDWFAEQLGLLQTEGKLYLNDRFNAFAIDLKSGNQLWKARITDGQTLSHAWSLIPMHPAETEDTLIMRYLTQHGPRLVCLKKSNGHRVWVAPNWTTDQQRENNILSDPVVAGDEALVLIGSESPRHLRVSLAAIAVADGKIRWQRPLGNFEQSIVAHKSCSVTRHQNQLIVSLGGGLLSCDLKGTLQWVRKLPWLSTSQYPEYVLQKYQRPVVYQNRLYVVQPGVPTISCVSPQNGNLLWRRVLYQGRSIVHLSEEKLCCRTSTGLVMLDAQSGELLWKHHDTKMLHAIAANSSGEIVYARQQHHAQKPADHVRLLWLSSETGDVNFQADLLDLQDKQAPRLGPFFSYQQKNYALFGQGLETSARELIELVPEN